MINLIVARNGQIYIDKSFFMRVHVLVFFLISETFAHVSS